MSSAGAVTLPFVGVGGAVGVGGLLDNHDVVVDGKVRDSYGYGYGYGYGYERTERSSSSSIMASQSAHAL